VTSPGLAAAVATLADGDPTFGAMIDRMAEAICRQMREDMSRSHDWATEPERHKAAFRRAAVSAFAAMGRPSEPTK